MNTLSLSRRTQCPTCGSEQLTSLYKESFFHKDIKAYLTSAYGQSSSFDMQCFEGEEYSLLQCAACDLIFQESIPELPMMAALYEQWIDADKALKQRSLYEIAYYVRYSQDISQLLSYIGRPPATVKVLDFAMGWGRWALMAKAFGCQVYGVELSEQRIEYAQKNGIEVIAWKDMPDYEFDIINADQVFEHLAEPTEVLAKLKQSLKSDGLIKICVPNSSGMRYRLKKMDWLAPKGSLKSLNPVAPLEHINCFYRKSMIEFARSAELIEVKVPIGMQYQSTTAWSSPNQVLRNLLMPIYRNILGLQNYYLFKNQPPSV